MPHAITWFEIPTADFARAQRFYETMLATSLVPMTAPDRQMAAFPADWTKGEMSGCIVHGQGSSPSATGTVVFLNCDPDLAPALARVERAGGRVILPKTEIPMQALVTWPSSWTPKGIRSGCTPRAEAGRSWLRRVSPAGR